MKPFSSRGAWLALALSIAATDVFAVPAFARRYEVACSFCHQVFPKLNRIGERFKERGFRLQNEDKFDGSAWIKHAPISGRLEGTRNLPEGGPGRNIGYFKVLSAGNLGTKLSYWVDDAWLRAGGDTIHIKPDNAWVRVDLAPLGRFYGKVGRFELDLPVTQTRTPHLLPYPIYGTNTGLETDGIGRYQEGMELGGEFGTTRISASLVKGRNNQAVVDLSKSTGVGDPGKFDGNVFLRVSRRLESSRFGAFAYVGRNQLVARISATRLGVAKDNIVRLGIDGNVRVKKLNVYGVALYGSNSNSVLSASQPSGTGEPLGFAGGFLAGDYHLGDGVALTARVQTRSVDLAGASDRASLTSFLPGVQIVIWKVKLSGQVNFSNNNVKRFSSLQVETAF
ncbi:MAG: hypothetical protein JJE39_02180 [Vicinamibacteria bacterium]|nr:hypothetical protein [Vicinamibacteria bacterium]